MSAAIHYTTVSSNSETDQDFVFLHGLGANIGQVEALLDDFAGIRLITADARGHGKSVFNPQQLPSFDQYCDDVIEVLDELGVQKAVFGGISMGSGISLNAALRYPDRVKGLVLVRPAWLDQGRPQNLEILMDIAEVIDQPRGKEKFEQSANFLAIQSELPKAAHSIMGQFSRDQGKYTAQVLNCMVKDFPFPSLEVLEEVDVPCLIVANEDDPLHPWQMAETLHHFIPNSQLTKIISRYIDGAQHKRALREAISSFLKTYL